MTNASPTDDTATETAVRIPVSESLLADIDATWQDAEYESREEFIRDAVHDAVQHPAKTRATWKETAAVEHALRTREDVTFAREHLAGK